MEIEFIKATSNRTKPKATVHLTGKLGFNIEASNLMKMDNKKAYLLGRDKNDANKFYLLESTEEGSIKASKAGNYYYLNAGSVFDTLEMDYEKNLFMFDISKDRFKDNEIFVLKRREVKERKKASKTGS